ncbi:hypothetical protein [Embleya sp. NPDC005575]|uniref:hypothetical protein n=1 Tax=Embleya sp. NPDC005575 TaxID=3156892 RepID=UPI0033BDF786
MLGLGQERNIGIRIENGIKVRIRSGPYERSTEFPDPCPDKAHRRFQPSTADANFPCSRNSRRRPGTSLVGRPPVNHPGNIAGRSIRRNSGRPDEAHREPLWHACRQAGIDPAEVRHIKVEYAEPDRTDGPFADSVQAAARAGVTGEKPRARPVTW